ncbi:hypothetical protein A4H97_29560 [Niastella yeongjuensis]|uniref:DUF3857 domain-containing protein n=1 Tax=Niastella yeongjuensis TaxID=354355 RepID=A0A1V9ESA8_9BACT|nr:hypothetical protein [Niastella yeongjuensis]OQP49029.1 hypothetical protein A4H97_29560 [Niastella yeongjuensis]SEP10856.1 hypothetical protein SAMN05660816_04409 [Niastella yeongjuensis]
MNNNKSHATVAFIIALLCICQTSRTLAQSYIDEDFLDVIEKNASLMLTEQPQVFNNNTTPAKWNNNSAVVIGYSRNILFDRKSSGGFFSRRERSLYFFEKTHFKIRLNDNNAVNAFSEIYFRYGSKEDGFIARITKPGDTAINIDLKNAVGVEGNADIPEYFKSYFDQEVGRSSYQYYKVPVSNLEPGDILEYVTTTKSKLDVTTSGYIEFSPNYEVCNKEYPILYNEIAIETDDKAFFKSLSLNGAPVFKKESTTEGFFRYVFIDKDRDIEKDVNFVSPFLQYPLVKFQVIYSNRDDVKGALVGVKGEVKTGFSKEELARKAWEDYEMVGDQPFSSYYYTTQLYIDQLWSELVKLDGKKMPEQQYIDMAYYLLRNKVVFMRDYLSDKKFAYIFGSLLYQRDIKSDLIITINNNIGQLNQVLFEQEIRYIIKRGDKLYFNLTDYSNPAELEENLLNNEAYIINKPAKKNGIPEIKPFTLPGTNTADNTIEYNISAELLADMKKMQITRTSSYRGIQKSKNISAALKYTTYMLDDYKNYGGADPTEKMKSKQVDEYNNSVRSLKEEYNTQKPEYVKESLEREFNQPVSNVRFTVVNDGRTQKKNILTCKEEFELTDFTRKAGKKYLVNLSGLTGSQLQIKKEERVRKYDIDVRSPKTYTWNIQFKIPAGYTAEGLTELNKKVDNEAGSFICNAKEENGTVNINIIKCYKAKNIPAAKWNDMLAFIDAGYNSTFKYILLKAK